MSDSLGSYRFIAGIKQVEWPNFSNKGSPLIAGVVEDDAVAHAGDGVPRFRVAPESQKSLPLGAEAERVNA